jgi:hypothetical protein
MCAVVAEIGIGRELRVELGPSDAAPVDGWIQQGLRELRHRQERGLRRLGLR